MKELIDMWNANLESTQKMVKEWNDKIIQQFQAGELLPEACLAALEMVPETIPYPSRAWAQWFKATWGWSYITRQNNESQYLGYDHPDMLAARQRVEELHTVHQVHKGLILNFDQLWRNCFATGRYRMCYKDRAMKGVRTKRKRMGPRVDKKVHTVRGARKSLTVAWCSKVGLLQSNMDPRERK